MEVAEVFQKNDPFYKECIENGGKPKGGWKEEESEKPNLTQNYFRKELNLSFASDHKEKQDLIDKCKDLEKKVSDLENSLKKKEEALQDVVGNHSKVENIIFLETLRKKYKIDKSQVELVEMIEKGGFGSVYKANYEGQIVACKIINIGDDEKIKEPSLEDLKEFLILADLKHPGIITVFGYDWNENTQEIWIVMELMPEGSLKRFVFGNKLTKEQKVYLMLQCAYSIKHVHTSKILHLNVNASNFLCKRNSGDVEVKLCGFGLAKVRQTSNTYTDTESKGTLLWMAPEMFSRMTKASTATDIYSLGMTFYEILFERYPYQNERGINGITIVAEVLKGLRPCLFLNPESDKNLMVNGMNDIPNEEIRQVAIQFKVLLEKCWDQEPSKRCSIQKIIEFLEEKKKVLDENNYSKRKSDTLFSEEVELKKRKFQ